MLASACATAVGGELLRRTRQMSRVLKVSRTGIRISAPENSLRSASTPGSTVK